MLPLAAAPAYTHSDMFCSGSGGGFSLSVIIQELTVTYFSTGPALLLLSLSVALRTPCALLLFFVLGIFFLSTSSICLLFARRYFRLPPSLSKRVPPLPRLPEFNPQTRFLRLFIVPRVDSVPAAAVHFPLSHSCLSSLLLFFSPSVLAWPRLSVSVGADGSLCWKITAGFGSRECHTR